MLLMGDTYLLSLTSRMAGECLCILMGNFSYILLSYNWSLFLHNKTLSGKKAHKESDRQGMRTIGQS